MRKVSKPILDMLTRNFIHQIIFEEQNLVKQDNVIENLA